MTEIPAGSVRDGDWADCEVIPEPRVPASSLVIDPRPDRPRTLPESPVQATIAILDEQHQTALNQQMKGDQKASALGAAGLAAAVVAAMVTTRSGSVDSWAGIVGIGTYAGMLVTVALTLWAVRPSLKGDEGIVRWARLTPAQIVAEARREAMDPEHAMLRRAKGTKLHSKIAKRRFGRLAWSIDAAFVTLVVAGVSRALSIAGW